MDKEKEALVKRAFDKVCETYKNTVHSPSFNEPSNTPYKNAVRMFMELDPEDNFVDEESNKLFIIMKTNWDLYNLTKVHARFSMVLNNMYDLCKLNKCVNPYIDYAESKKIKKNIEPETMLGVTEDFSAETTSNKNIFSKIFKKES